MRGELGASDRAWALNRVQGDDGAEACGAAKDLPVASRKISRDHFGLALLLVLAAVLRTLAALTPGFHHPDAIYQYLEPAYRLLTGDGLITWEWRVGMRSWLLPTLLAAPMAIGRSLDPGGDLYLLLPRLFVGLASLSIVWSAWAIGDRHSRRSAWLAGFVAATWFEFVHFGVQTLAEPVAVAAFLPAVALLVAPRPTARAMAAAGALLALSLLMRPHYGPAALALVLVARRGDLRRALPALVCGGLATAAASAAIDLANHSIPMFWIVENIRQNVIEHRVDAYGVAPPFAFLAWYIKMWGWFAIPMLVGMRFGWRHCVPLLIVAVVSLAVHSLIGHKEYRFVFLTTASLVIVSAIGWGELLRLASKKWPRWEMVAILAVCTMWGIASIALADSHAMTRARLEGRAGTSLFAAIRHDPQACGVAIVEGSSFADMPGLASLRPGTSIQVFAAGDPAYGRAGVRGALAATRSHYNRVVTTDPMSRLLPAGYSRGECEPWEKSRLCVFSRQNMCNSAAASPFDANVALRRLGY